MLDMADKEFGGKSFNGPSLMETLDSLSAAQAASAATYEGYSAWETALHCLYYKYLIAEALGAGKELEPYPYLKANFAHVPAGSNEADWKDFRDYLRLAHRVCMDEIRSSSAEKLETKFALWDISFREAISWLCTHDCYHNAQIRSMGLPSLRQPKEA
jgi:hypothetical protein